MKAWQWTVVAVACLAAAACRSDPNIPYLERDLRLQEDKIYQLKALREDDEAVLDSCRRENATLRKRLAENEEASAGTGSSPDSQAAPRWSGPSGAPGPVVKPPDVNLGEPSTEIPDTFKPRPKAKATERSTTPDRDSEAPRAKPTSDAPPAKLDVETPHIEVPAKETAMSGPALLPGMADEEPAANSGTVSVAAPAKTGPAPSPRAAKAAAGDNQQVQTIVLNRLLTGGYNTSGKSGHDGVMVVVEPRDAQGKVLAVPGDLSVVVVDPELAGEAARVARWDFTADEVAARFRKTIVANGVQLEMPWPADPPRHEDLHVFVRYTTADGRKLVAEKAIKVKLPIEVVQRNAAEHKWARKPPASEPAAEIASSAPQSASGVSAWRAAPAPTVRVPTSPMTRAVARTSRGVESTAARPVWSPTRQ